MAKLEPGTGGLTSAWSNLVWLLKTRPDLRLVAPGGPRGQADEWTIDQGDYAEVYFRAIRVLSALDADHDLVISAAEIANAPAVLRILDQNHDGKLTAEECGGAVLPGTRPQSVMHAQVAFMRFHPVLAALDADHDGEISAVEIENAPAALRTLDRNDDSKLTPDEILPKRGTPVR